MNNAEMYVTLQGLVLTAEALNRNLILDEKIILVSYNKKGNIKSTHRYEYDDNDIKDLEKYLKQIAADYRKKWKPEFKLFTPTIENLHMTLAFELANVELYDAKGNISLYNYDDNGLRKFTENIADALLAKHDAELDEEGTANCHNDDKCSTCKDSSCKGNCSNCEGCNNDCSHKNIPTNAVGKCSEENCNNCENDYCKKNPNAALLIWNKLDQDQQNLISCSLSHEDQETLFAALGMAEKNS